MVRNFYKENSSEFGAEPSKAWQHKLICIVAFTINLLSYSFSWFLLDLQFFHTINFEQGSIFSFTAWLFLSTSNTHD